VEVLEMDTNINDEAFADAVFDLFRKHWDMRTHSDQPAQTVPANA
jgi:hypothetical protein